MMEIASSACLVYRALASASTCALQKKQVQGADKVRFPLEETARECIPALFPGLRSARIRWPLTWKIIAL